MTVVDTLIDNEQIFKLLKEQNQWSAIRDNRLIEKTCLLHPWHYFSDPELAYHFPISPDRSLYFPLTSVYQSNDIKFQFDYVSTGYSSGTIGENIALMAHSDIDSGENWLEKKQAKEEELESGKFWSEQSHLRVQEVKVKDNQLHVKYEKADYLSFLLSNHHFRGSVESSPTQQFNISNTVNPFLKEEQTQVNTLFKASTYLQNEMAVIGLIISVDWEGEVYVWLTNRSSSLLTNRGGISVSLSGAMGGDDYDDSQYLEVIFKDKQEAQSVLKSWLKREPILKHTHNFQHALGYSTFLHHLRGIDKKRVMKKLGTKFSFPFFRYNFSTPNPKLTFVRELFEETGVRLHPEHVMLNCLFHQAYEQQLIISGFACFFGDRHYQLLEQLSINYNENGNSPMFKEQDNFVGLRLDAMGIDYLADLMLNCWWPPISLASLIESLKGFEQQWQNIYQKHFSKELTILADIKKQMALKNNQ